ncbi:Putative O-methyltransferase domain, S-adenosyl-L-methionine-dependent methyltransferase [Septoria linicola]|uniref:O-methyltransferase domain, S-adenosyl-L-methionine-dependent methyltransferase n=1 Tax=Septoria linicola TaxID=215465 RepID=A0A9Q9AP02_9PEZI|nr:putative O-methyltransferase domain, S-adenosyl-L-methionine-dependent methyltransferase [Septoria linicola]USW52460.1 Putative O-methyltransferase domain, S-adenosyl-L-methionine-dependent methyltransferase [Septoria linicola]
MADKVARRSDSVIDQPLNALSAEISSSTAIVTKFLEENGHPQPSFDSSSPTSFPLDAPPNVQAARHRLIAAARDLHLLAYWPIDCGMYLTGDGCHLVYQHFITHFHIADNVPLQGSISYTDLASKLDLPVQKTTRILRYAMVDHIFREPQLGYIAHTALSRALRKDSAIPVVPCMMANIVENYMDALPKYVESIEKYGHEVETGENAPGTLGYGKPIMEFLAENPKNLAILSATMEETKKASWADLRQFVNGYEWAGIGGGVVVDVGGGEGPIAKAIASAFPQIHCVVHDRPSAVAKGQAECPKAIASRVSWQAHDFFQPNPIKGADVYFMRWILHDWPDHSSAEILRNIAVSMGEKSRIVIADMVVPDPGVDNAVMEELYRRIDIIMMSMNGIERSLGQWEDLIGSVEGLKIASVRKLGQGVFSLIEVVKG